MPWQNRLLVLNPKTGMKKFQTVLLPKVRAYYSQCLIDKDNIYILYQKSDRNLRQRQYGVMSLSLKTGKIDWDYTLEFFGYPNIHQSRKHIMVEENSNNAEKALTIISKDKGKLVNSIGKLQKAEADKKKKDPAKHILTNIKTFYYTRLGVGIKTDKQLIFFSTIKKNTP